MKVNITINCGNAAFDLDHGGPAHEVARILKKLAKRIEDEGIDLPNYDVPLHDINGNKVGKLEVEGWEACADPDSEDQDEDEDSDEGE